MLYYAILEKEHGNIEGVIFMSGDYDALVYIGKYDFVLYKAEELRELIRRKLLNERDDGSDVWARDARASREEAAAGLHGS